MGGHQTNLTKLTPGTQNNYLIKLQISYFLSDNFFDTKNQDNVKCSIF